MDLQAELMYVERGNLTENIVRWYFKVFLILCKKNPRWSQFHKKEEINAQFYSCLSVYIRSMALSDSKFVFNTVLFLKPSDFHMFLRVKTELKQI